MTWDFGLHLLAGFQALQTWAGRYWSVMSYVYFLLSPLSSSHVYLRMQDISHGIYLCYNFGVHGTWESCEARRKHNALHTIQRSYSYQARDTIPMYI